MYLLGMLSDIMMGNVFINCKTLVTEVVVDAAVPGGGASYHLKNKIYEHGQ